MSLDNRKQEVERRILLLPLMDKVKPTIDEVQIVITAPSRELANQIYQEARELARFSQPEIRVSNFAGGTDKQRQLIN